MSIGVILSISYSLLYYIIYFIKTIISSHLNIRYYNIIIKTIISYIYINVDMITEINKFNVNNNIHSYTNWVY